MAASPVVIFRWRWQGRQSRCYAVSVRHQKYCTTQARWTRQGPASSDLETCRRSCQ